MKNLQNLQNLKISKKNSSIIIVFFLFLIIFSSIPNNNSKSSSPKFVVEGSFEEHINGFTNITYTIYTDTVDLNLMKKYADSKSKVSDNQMLEIFFFNNLKFTPKINYNNYYSHPDWTRENPWRTHWIGYYVKYDNDNPVIYNPHSTKF